jgi:hypothetical protein
MPAHQLGETGDVTRCRAAGKFLIGQLFPSFRRTTT